MEYERLQALLRILNNSWGHEPPVPPPPNAHSPYTKACDKVAEWEHWNDPTLLLDLSSMGLKCLPPLPPTVERLACCDNSLQMLPSLPPTLRVLHADRNCLITLPPLPDSLDQLVVTKNSLRSLPPLPPNLLHLYAGFCHLETLPTLPPSLVTLSVPGNRIATLPPLPPGLRHLSIDQNPVERVTIPFPPTLQALCTHLTNLPHVINYTENSAVIAQYAEELDAAQDALDAPPRIHSRTHLLKEELAAAAWRPERVERWLNAGLDVAAL